MRFSCEVGDCWCCISGEVQSSFQQRAGPGLCQGMSYTVCGFALYFIVHIERFIVPQSTNFMRFSQVERNMVPELVPELVPEMWFCFSLFFVIHFEQQSINQTLSPQALC